MTAKSIAELVNWEDAVEPFYQFDWDWIKETSSLLKFSESTTGILLGVIIVVSIYSLKQLEANPSLQETR